MATPSATGNNALNFHPTELLISGQRGMSFRQHVTAGVLTPTARAAMFALVQQVQGLGGSGRMKFDTAVPSFEYELSGLPSNLTGELTELFWDDWQLQIDDLTNTIFANQVLAAQLLYNDYMVLMRYMKLGSATPLSDVVDSLNTDLAASTVIAPNVGNGGTADGKFQAPRSNGAYTALAKQVFKMIDRDQAEFMDPLPVLHHTSACSPGSTYNVSRHHEMCIYSTAQLLSEVGSGWTYNLPARLYSAVSTISIDMAKSVAPWATDEAPYFTWGWLKMRQTQRTQANLAIEVHDEYKLNLWPNIYYQLR